MKYFFFFFLISFFLKAQISNYNQYPTKTPPRDIDLATGMLDSYATNLAVAFSMRKIKKDYTGPLIKLRRSSDNQERNFYPSDNNVKLDSSEISNWSGTSNLFVVVWYDQSGNESHALQLTNTNQPRFYNNSGIPYWRGNGSNQYLIIQADARTELLNNGREGTVLLITKATDRAQSTFGAISPNSNSNRWLTHINWSNKRVYFDPGTCCINPARYYSNNFYPLPIENSYYVYSFRRSYNRTYMWKNIIQKKNAFFDQSYSYTANTKFGLGAVSRGNGNQFAGAANNPFVEFVMFNTDKNDTDINTLQTLMKNDWSI